MNRSKLRQLIRRAILALVLSLPTAASAEEARLVTTTGRMHGTLDLPETSPPFPVALIIAGSGPTDRDGNQPFMRNDSLKQLGRALAQRGIAGLRYDKRGIGESATAAASEADLRLETSVSDAADWVAWLRRDTRFARVAVIGHSEGALIGLLAARRRSMPSSPSPGPGDPLRRSCESRSRSFR